MKMIRLLLVASTISMMFFGSVSRGATFVGTTDSVGTFGQDLTSAASPSTVLRVRVAVTCEGAPVRDLYLIMSSGSLKGDVAEVNSASLRAGTQHALIRFAFGQKDSDRQHTKLQPERSWRDLYGRGNRECGRLFPIAISTRLSRAERCKFGEVAEGEHEIHFEKCVCLTRHACRVRDSIRGFCLESTGRPGIRTRHRVWSACGLPDDPAP